MSAKLKAGQKFPEIKMNLLNGKEVQLGKASEGHDWQMIVVYRGKHCPICKKYLEALKPKKKEFEKIGVEVLAISADPKERAKEFTHDDIEVNFNIGYDLSIEQMKELGLYISEPRSPKETDRPFSEPGLFVVNEKGDLHVVEIANNPFIRPDLDILLDGLKFIKNPENDYPIRGTL